MSAGIILGPEFDWQSQATCARVETTPEAQRQYADRFFPNGRPSASFKKQMCDDCPVRTACLEHALTYDEPGVWGGTTEKERELLQRGRSIERQGEAL